MFGDQTEADVDSAISAQIAAVLTVIALLVSFGSPASAQLIDTGTFDPSLECGRAFVDGVQPDDSLNVREGPGVIYSIVLTLEPAAPAITTGLTSAVGNSTWYQIGIGSCDPVGWVNSSFLELEARTLVPETPTTAVDTAPPPADELGPGGDAESPDVDQDSAGLTLSPFATALLALGVFGLLAGITMFVLGRSSARDEGPPPGMVGPPGGPYFLARIDSRTTEPKTITVGGAPKAPEARRSNDLSSEPIDEPLSAFPSLPDLASEIEADTDKIKRPSTRLFDTQSFGARNSAEDEIGS